MPLRFFIYYHDFFIDAFCHFRPFEPHKSHIYIAWYKNNASQIQFKTYDKMWDFTFGLNH